MSEELFKERYLELPAFQRIRSILDEGIDGVFSLNELTTRVMMALEDGLNWHTMCQNCGVLMDDNYAQHVEIEALRNGVDALKEDLAYAENEIRELNEELRCAEARYYNEGLD